MSRKRTGTIIREGDHFVALVTLDDGHRKRIPLPAGISEAAAREKAAFYSENAAKIPDEPKAAAIPKGETFAEYSERWLADRDARGFSGINIDLERLVISETHDPARLDRDREVASNNRPPNPKHLRGVVFCSPWKVTALQPAVHMPGKELSRARDRRSFQR